MKSKFYEPGAQRAEKVHDLFATIARRYDRLNDLMSFGWHRRWKNRLVKLAGQPRRVLDLCCGSGDIALRFAASDVVGADFTHEMLQVAQVRPAPRRSVLWVQADALRLPFPDAHFDVVSIGYGLRNLADLEAGLREIQRVLQPGGRLLSLDFGKPAQRWLRRAYFAWLRTTVPLLGRLFGGNAEAYAYILASLEDYPAQRGIAELMTKLGFVDVGFEEYWAGAMAINYGRRAGSSA